jgi:tetratricopeptide (TPR) repeat protein
MTVGATHVEPQTVVAHPPGGYGSALRLDRLLAHSSTPAGVTLDNFRRLHVGFSFQDLESLFQPENPFEKGPRDPRSSRVEFTSTGERIFLYKGEEGQARFVLGFQLPRLCLGEKKEYDRAIQDFDEAIRLNPKNTLAYYWRGTVWSYKQSCDKAISDYDVAIRLNPRCVEAFAYRGYAFQFEKE